MTSLKYYNIILLNRPISLTYSSKNNINIGSIVVVKIKSGSYYGICISEISKDNALSENFTIKEVDCVFSESLINENFISFLKEFSYYNAAKIETIPYFTQINKIISILSQDVFTIEEDFEKKAEDSFKENTKLKKFYNKIISNKDKIKSIILSKKLLSKDNIKEVFKDIPMKTIISTKIISVKKNLTGLKSSKDLFIKKDNFNSAKEIVLNKDQNLVVCNLLKSFKNGFSSTLLYGSTGSGKTETYLYVAKHMLINQTSCNILIMVPEISLVPELRSKIIQYIGIEPLEIHSGLKDSLFKNNIQKLFSCNKNIIIGVRSAILIPYIKLDWIVVDEEHDQSYKQSDSICYNARNMAVVLAKIHNVPIVLSSGTPSIETYYNAQTKKYKLETLKGSFYKMPKPQISLLDMSNHNKKDGMLSFDAISKIQSILNKGLQCLVFLNKRGYSSFLLCPKCNVSPKCNNCDIYLSFHKSKKILKCHLCGTSTKQDLDKCSKCEGKWLLIGNGIEKIKQEIEEKVSGSNIAIVSSDFANRNNIDDLIKDIKDCKYNVIVGTQMISKGHNFPKLALTIIVDIDSHNSHIDIRNFERSYQLIKQISGRSGRFDIKGESLIQTSDPNNPILKSMISNEDSVFYMNEIQRRMGLKIYPFMFQAILVSRHYMDNEAYKIISAVYKNLLKWKSSNSSNIKIFGPSQSQIKYIKNKYRYNILIEEEGFQKIRSAAMFLSSSLDKKIAQFVHVDINPYYFY